MGQTRILLDSAADTGILAFPSQNAGNEYKSNNLAEATELIERFTKKAKGRTTLFLGAAISTFKPAQLPMWNDFVKLLWTSALQVATTDLELDQASKELLDFFDRVKDHVPNYMITEVISRRLGQQYLQVLDAFQAERLEDGSYAFNEIHRWTADLLATGKVAAVMTTNFDNYLEKAIESQTDLYCQVTGDPHIDGREISSRLPLASPTRSLVLIVNGAKAFAFVRSLMPQLGAGKVTFLFKVHGSCYEPVSCIDTRLQRAQGLPSFATDVLDTLLKRTVWLVAGFSGSDMNDNLDYLRFLSGKKDASIIWLTYPGSRWESAMQRLVPIMSPEKDGSTGLCVVQGHFVGERHSGKSKFPQFEEKIISWAEGLGPQWSTLLLVDLAALFEEKSGQQAPSDLLQVFNGGETPRQDWNNILQNMDLTAEVSQIPAAISCSTMWQLLSLILGGDNLGGKMTAEEIRRHLDSSLQKLGAHHIEFQEAASREDHPQQHAQTWVISALSGLAMLCGGQFEEAAKSFEVSSGIAWLVGNYEHHQMLEGLLRTILHGHTISHDSHADDYRSTKQSLRCIAFSPAMDNVNSKLNRYGVPPQNYMRALLHRSILFADGMVVPISIISNSTVFVDEVLFQGEHDRLNEIYIRHLYPIMPMDFKDEPRKLRKFRETRPKGFIFESVDDEHLAQLDEYFGNPANAHQVLYFDEPTVGRNYGKYIRTAVSRRRREATISHLVQLWSHLDAGGHWDVHHDHAVRTAAARKAAEDLTKSLLLLEKALPEAVRRSPLYMFADLFDEASDWKSIVGFLKSDTSEDTKLQLMEARNGIIDRPWLYGPFCHELFDAPYRAALTFDYASRAKIETVLFLEEDEVASWEFMSSVCHSEGFPVQFTTSPISAGSHQFSSLPLSQMTPATLRKARKDLAPIQARIEAGKPLRDDDVEHLKAAMASFESRSLALPEVEIEKIVKLEKSTKDAARALLADCIFLVRRGPPLDPMYEEAQITLPGLVALRKK